MEVNMTEIPMEEIELKFSKFFDIEFGGHWKPKDCRPRWKVGLQPVCVLQTCGLWVKPLQWVHVSHSSFCAAGGHPDSISKPP